MSKLKVGDAAPDLTMPNDSGEEVRLAELWSDRPLVLLFLRHLG